MYDKNKLVVEFMDGVLDSCYKYFSICCDYWNIQYHTALSHSNAHRGTICALMV